MDLSAPRGNSVNDVSWPCDGSGSGSEPGSRHFAGKDGPKNVYRLLPVHSDDHPLLALSMERVHIH